MELQEVVNYLAAAAAADAPIDGRERDLMDHLLQDFGATHNEASKLIGALPDPFNLKPTIDSLESRETGLKLLRALLVISYCDGTFDAEELPFLEPLVDKFQVRADELRRLKQQALYFLGLRAPAIEISQDLVASGDWDKVCEVAQTQYQTTCATTSAALRKSSTPPTRKPVTWLSMWGRLLSISLTPETDFFRAIPIFSISTTPPVSNC